MSYTHGTDVLYRVRVFVCEIGKRIRPDQFALEYICLPALRGFLYHIHTTCL